MEDDIAMLKAQIFLQENSIDKAIQELERVLNLNISSLWADDALFQLAEIYEKKTMQQDKAMELYQRLITDFPSSLLVLESRQRFRKLRGDQLE